MVMGTWLAWTSRVRSFQGIPEISYSWVTASAVAGGLLLFITTFLKIRDELRGAASRLARRRTSSRCSGCWSRSRCCC